MYTCYFSKKGLTILEAVIEGQTTQWPKEKGQKDKQRSTKYTQKTEDRAKRIPLKPGVTSSLIFIHVVLLIDIYIYV